MALEVLQLGFLALASLVFVFCYFRFQKPLAGFIAATLFLVLGFQLLVNGYSVSLFSSSSVNQTNFYSNFTVNESFYNSSGSFNSSVIKQVPVLSNFTQVSNGGSVSYSGQKDSFTDFTGLVFVLLGLFLTIISGYELVTRPSKRVS